MAREKWAPDRPEWWNRLHELWTKAAVGREYDKKEWQDFERCLFKEIKVLKSLPKYRCHKEVWALRIAAIQPMEDGSLRIFPFEEGYESFIVEKKFVPTHGPARPEAGWYFVQYEDNYKSFSPPEAFENGYTRIEL